MNKILFVCHGNICRSVMAEYIMKSIAPDLIVESRATSTEEIGNDIYPNIKKVLDKNNIKYSRHYAKQITKKDYDDFDLIIVMDDFNLYNLSRMIGQLDKNKVYKLNNFIGSSKDVDDPWYTRNFDDCYIEIYEACNALKNKLMR